MKTLRGRPLVLTRAAETSREVGILALVFGLLDEYHRATPAAPVRAEWVAAVLGIGFFFIVAGIASEWALSSSVEDSP